MIFAAGLTKDTPVQTSHTPAPQSLAAKPEKERVSGYLDFLKKMDRKKCATLPSRDPHLTSHEMRVVAQVRAFLVAPSTPGASSAARLLTWWRIQGPRHYPDLLPGVRILLGLSAGNGALERLFGQARYLLTPQRLNNDLSALLLKANAPQLGLPGYAKPTAAVALDDAEIDDDLEFAVLLALLPEPGNGALFASHVLPMGCSTWLVLRCFAGSGSLCPRLLFERRLVLASVSFCALDRIAYIHTAVSD